MTSNAHTGYGMTTMRTPLAVDIPKQSELFERRKQFDWFDAYQIDVDIPDLTVWKACEDFLDLSPFWVGWLFGIRNLAVRCVGLSTASLSLHEAKQRLATLESEPAERFPLDTGVAGVRIDFASDREIVAGADDWHLDFRGSIFTQKLEGGRSRLTATTLVKFNHWFGRLYFFPVKPFHKLIVRAMLKRLERHYRR